MRNDQLVDRDEYRICRWCGHNSNPCTATVCEVCDRPLDKAPLGLPILLLGLSALVLLVGGGYWLWRQQPPVSRSAAQIVRASGIRIYRTMQDVPNVPKGLFSYHGAHSFASFTRAGMNDAIRQAFPEFQLRYTDPVQANPGSTVAIQMLINGEVDIAQIARPLEDVELIRANERTLKLDQIPVAIDGIVFYVNPNLSIPGLSLSQAQDIYVGKITNWREVGGPNVAIVPFSLEPKAVGATRQALGDVADKLSPRVRIIRDNTGGVRQVASTPGGISFAGASTIIGQRSVRILSIARGASTAYVSPITSSGGINKQAWRDGTYPITRRLFIAIRRNGSLEEQAGVAYANLVLSEEGQRIIERAGFVSLYQPDP